MSEKELRSLRSDATLVRECLSKQGTSAFAELVDRYKGMVVGCAYSIMKDRHEAEDVAQEAFVKAYSSLATLRTPPEFSSWLVSIVRNAAFSRASSKKRREPAATGEGDTGPHAPTPGAQDPAAVASRRELQELVLRELDSLPLHYRRTVHLHYLKGYGCRQIAQVEGTSTGVITSRLTRAIGILRQKLGRLVEEKRR